MKEIREISHGHVRHAREIPHGHVEHGREISPGNFRDARPRVFKLQTEQMSRRDGQGSSSLQVVRGVLRRTSVGRACFIHPLLQNNSFAPE